MKFVSRSKWGARRAKAATPQTITKSSKLYIHYTAGQGRGIETFKEQAATMRSIQRYHQDNNGWSDIGYSYVVFQPYGLLKKARLFQGRSFGVVPAAQSGDNTGNGAIAVVAAPGEKLKWQTRRLLKKAYRHFKGRQIRGHRDAPGAATACPGDAIYKFIAVWQRKVTAKQKPFLP